MSILNEYVKKEGKTTWIEMDTFPLIYTTLATKIKISSSSLLSAKTQKYFVLFKRLKVLSKPIMSIFK